MLPSRLIRLVPLAVLLALPAVGQTRSLALEPCTERGLPADARCGTLQVPENRDRPGGRQLSLYVVVIPARTAAPAREALTFFGGGPGQAIAGSAGPFGELFEPVRETRDLLFVDQRGTGRSSPLKCHFRDPDNPQTYLDRFIPPDGAAQCRDSLARTADLARYGYPELAHDVEAVRTALGYEALDLWGGSYGTRAALVYARMYPRRVRSMILHGLAPAEYLQPADYATDMQAALDGLMAYCRADAACHAAFPDAAAEVRALADRLGARPATAEILDAATGRAVRLTLARGTFAETLRRMLYEPSNANRIPYVVHQAFTGDYRPLLRQALADRRGMEGSVGGLFLSINCSEDIPFIDPAAVARQNGTTLLGDYRYTQQAAACRGWPTYTPPADYHQPVRSDVPVLLLSGELDPVTPPRWGTMAAAALPNALHVIVPGAGHGFGGMEGAECVESMMVQFAVQRSARGLDTDCVQRMRRPAFLTEMQRTVTMEPAALRRLAGSYASAQPSVQAQVEAAGEGLIVRLSQGGVLAALPITPTRFVWESSPAGWEMVFGDDAGTLTLRRPGQPDVVLARRP
ncbi:MAG TPA: alpha/beta hydrolase [Longimicrobium sp.]|nr:alpha/beta hydrolase [Longimicrobium sp.]